MGFEGRLFPKSTHRLCLLEMGKCFWETASNQIYDSADIIDNSQPKGENIIEGIYYEAA